MLGEKVEQSVVDILNGIQAKMPEVTEGLLQYISLDAKTSLMWALGD